ncbi:MAG: response regulator [Sphingobium sp.]|nr:response regulator [Sphingobium sp.]
MVTAKNGTLAVDRYKRSNFDLVLMDIQMPELNGLDATRQIRALENGATVPIIALTANAFKADQERCTEAGMTDFLAKPVFPDALHVMLKKYLPEKDSSTHAAPQPHDDEAAGKAGAQVLLKKLTHLASCWARETSRQLTTSII